jgi:hypothetical protein
MRKEEGNPRKSGGRIHPSPNLLQIPYRRQNAHQNPNENPQEEGAREHLYSTPFLKTKSEKKSIQDSRERGFLKENRNEEH